MVTVLNEEFDKILLPEAMFFESQFENKERVCYLEYEDGFSISPKCKITDDVTSGIYSVQYTREGIFYPSLNICLDDYVDLNNATQKEIVREILDFSKKGDLFQKAGIVHKRGIFLHGIPGSGKTSLINHIMSSLIREGALGFFVREPGSLKALIDGLTIIKKISPTRQIIVVFEEIDQFQGQDQELLNFLDGQNSLQNIIFLATTNRIDEVNPALLRSSRFDWIIEVNALSPTQREKYLRSKGIEENIDTWVKDTDGFTVAMLKELFISVILLENTYKDVLTKIRSMEQHSKLNTFKPKKIGFKKAEE